MCAVCGRGPAGSCGWHFFVFGNRLNEGAARQRCGQRTEAQASDRECGPNPPGPGGAGSLRVHGRAGGAAARQAREAWRAGKLDDGPGAAEVQVHQRQARARPYNCATPAHH